MAKRSVAISYIIILFVCATLIATVHSIEGKKWCVPKPGAPVAQLQANIDNVCGQGIDCKPIQVGGPCAFPTDVASRAAYAMNAYYQAKGHEDVNCDFSQTGVVTDVDPSHDNCIIPDVAQAVQQPGQKQGQVQQPGQGQPQKPSKTWCIAKSKAPHEQLQANLDSLCGGGIDCKPIQVGGACEHPDDVGSRASYVMNAFYQARGKNDGDCNFNNTGLITPVDPSHGTCIFPA